LDRRVVADVEVQEADLLERPPIAPVENVAFAHVERAGDDVTPAARDDEAEALPPALAEELEESLVQVLAAPIELVDRRVIEAKHDGQELVRDVVAGENLDTDVLLDERAPLAPHLGSALGLERPEIVFERAPARIRPMILVAFASFETAGGERLDLVRLTEVDV